EGNQFHARAQTCHMRWGTWNYIPYITLFGCNNAHGETEINNASEFFRSLHGGVRLIVVDQLPSAVFDAAQRGMCRFRIQPLAQEAAPVIGRYLVQSCDHILECIRDNLGRAAGSAVESTAEIVERFLPTGLAADQGVNLEPKQVAFGVVVGRTS